MGVEYRLGLDLGDMGDEAHFHVSGAEALPRPGDIIFISRGELKDTASEMDKDLIRVNYQHEYVVNRVYHHVLIERRAFQENPKNLYRARSNGIPEVFAEPLNKRS